MSWNTFKLVRRRFQPALKNEYSTTYREYTVNSKTQLYRELPQPPIYIKKLKKKCQAIVLIIPRIYSASDLANALNLPLCKLPDNQVSTVLISWIIREFQKCTGLLYRNNKTSNGVKRGSAEGRRQKIMKAVLQQCTPLCGCVNACFFHPQKPHYMSPKCSQSVTMTGCARTWHQRALRADTL